MSITSFLKKEAAGIAKKCEGLKKSDSNRSRSRTGGPCRGTCIALGTDSIFGRIGAYPHDQPRLPRLSARCIFRLCNHSKEPLSSSEHAPPNIRRNLSREFCFRIRPPDSGMSATTTERSNTTPKQPGGITGKGFGKGDFPCLASERWPR